MEDIDDPELVAMFKEDNYGLGPPFSLRDAGVNAGLMMRNLWRMIFIAGT